MFDKFCNFIYYCQNSNINDDEIKFLKFLNKKNVNTTFSVRWNGCNIKPDLEIKKLLKLGYLKTSTFEEASIYILTEKGNKKIDDNIHLFLTDRDKDESIFQDLTNAEYNQLKVFQKLDEYKILKQNNLSYDKGYSKYDILWSIYDDVALKYSKKDFVMCSIAYHRMSELVYKEKKYKYALELLIVALYYHILDFYNYDKNLYERHIQKYHTLLTKYITSCNLAISNIDELRLLFNNSVTRYLPNKNQNVLELLIVNYWKYVNNC